MSEPLRQDLKLPFFFEEYGCKFKLDDEGTISRREEVQRGRFDWTRPTFTGQYALPIAQQAYALGFKAGAEHSAALQEKVERLEKALKQAINLGHIELGNEACYYGPEEATEHTVNAYAYVGGGGNQDECPELAEYLRSLSSPTNKQEGDQS